MIFHALREPNGASQESKMAPSWLPKRAIIVATKTDRIQRGSQGALWEHFKIIVDVFLSYFDEVLCCFLCVLL